MTIKKLSGRQSPIVGIATFAFGDVVDDTYMPAVDLPAGAIVTGGFLALDELFNSATDDKFSIGQQVAADSAVKTTYAALSADITALPAIVPIVPTGVVLDRPATVGVVWNGSGSAPSAGKGRLVVEYVVDGRALFSQG